VVPVAALSLVAGVLDCGAFVARMIAGRMLSALLSSTVVAESDCYLFIVSPFVVDWRHMKGDSCWIACTSLSWLQFSCKVVVLICRLLSHCFRAVPLLFFVYSRSDWIFTSNWTDCMGSEFVKDFILYIKSS
jgi:hypothetical protein